MSQYLDWKVGDRVVCVDANVKGPFHKPLVKGRVYTIRKILAHPKTDDIGVTLDEIVNDIHPTCGLERCYEIRRFRKVQPRKTDIGIFTAMLHSADQKVRA